MDFKALAESMEALENANHVRKLFWTCIGVAALFGVAAVLQGIAALRLW